MFELIRPPHSPVRRLILVAACALALSATRADEPLWAYGFVQPAAPGEKAGPPSPPAKALRQDEPADEQTRPRRLAGSSGTYSLQQIRNGNDVVDWFPEDHPPLTPILRQGPASLGPNAYGCAFCHLPNGKGKPENAPLAGLPVAYFVRQLEDMRAGLRASAEPRKGNTVLMIALAQAMTAAEMRESADYFARLSWGQPWIRVVETERVPRSKVVAGLFVPIEEAATEPLAGRIMEMPEKPENTEILRDPRAGFVAYVPVGSIARGKPLVETGGGKMVDGKQEGGKTLACTTCHGPDLRGVAEIPGIAGRSPSYVVRQMYDIQQGTRKSTLSQAMLPVVANLTADDMVAIAAYIATLSP